MDNRKYGDSQLVKMLWIQDWAQQSWPSLSPTPLPKNTTQKKLGRMWGPEQRGVLWNAVSRTWHGYSSTHSRGGHHHKTWTRASQPKLHIDPTDDLWASFLTEELLACYSCLRRGSHIHTHTSTQTYTHIGTHIHTFIHRDTDTQIHTQAHTETRIYTHIHIDTQTHIQRQTHKYTERHTETYTHINTQTHKHTHMSPGLS